MAEAIYDYQFRIIVIGDSNTGKSSLIRWYTDRKPATPAAKYRPTIGADYFVRIIEAAPGCSTRIRLQIWDTAGQERYRAITKSYYRNSIGVVLVFDITRRDTFNHIPDWFEECQIHVLPHKAVFILVGNKVDLDGPRPRVVSREEAEEFAEDNHMPYIETSTVSGLNIDECFTVLGQQIFAKLRSGEIQAEHGWEAIKDHYTADTKVKLSASNRDRKSLKNAGCS